MVQLWNGGTDVVSTPVRLPSLQPGEVLVKIRLATVCGSDLHTVAGRRHSPAPGVLGHEAVGDVIAVGGGGASDVGGQPVSAGDRVVWSVVVSCGECDRCLAGRSAKCRAVRKIGHEPFDGAWRLSGCYATHVHLPRGVHLVRIPEHVPDSVAAPAACATATVVAAIDRAGGLTGRRVLISGAGMLGITATALAAAEGASDVVVTDVHPERLSLADEFGAHRTLDVSGAAEGQVMAAGNGRFPGQDSSPAGGTAAKFDVALDFSGAADAVEQAFGALDVGGVLVLAGSVAPGREVRLDPERAVRRWLSVRGVHNYEPCHLASAVELLARTTDRYPWARLVDEP
ncbi:zinc-binding dehydrogenase, partial [Phytoactinopolyspora endophytica]|uniref:zinc-binding dehydrogenase n=1 Tax=Phytoactinopolyspora endophytica TaxID=1642495 RepID=UPI00101BF847